VNDESGINVRAGVGECAATYIYSNYAFVRVYV